MTLITSALLQYGALQRQFNLPYVPLWAIAIATLLVDIGAHLSR